MVLITLLAYIATAQQLDLLSSLNYEKIFKMSTCSTNIQVMDSDFKKYIILGGRTSQIPGSTECYTNASRNAFIIIYDATTDTQRLIFTVDSGSSLLNDQYFYMEPPA